MSSTRKQAETMSRKAWQRATAVLLWYPDSLLERDMLVDELLSRDPERVGGSGPAQLHHDPTASAAIRLAGSRRLATLEQEIEAVELAVDGLLPDQRIIIRRRFFDIPKGPGVARKPRQYDFLQDIGYSERTMRRVSRQAIMAVAAYLGER